MDSLDSEQGASPQQPGEQLQAEWREMTPEMRLFMSVCMSIGAFGGLYGGHTVLVLFSHHWFAWALSLAVLEPVGLASALGLVIVNFPRSRLAGWAARLFASTLGRAKIAAILVGLVFGAAGVFVVGALLYALWLNHLR